MTSVTWQLNCPPFVVVWNGSVQNCSLQIHRTFGGGVDSSKASVSITDVVALRPARLILGWVTFCKVSRYECSQPPRSTQPSILVCVRANLLTLSFSKTEFLITFTTDERHTHELPVNVYRHQWLDNLTACMHIARGRDHVCCRESILVMVMMIRWTEFAEWEARQKRRQLQYEESVKMSNVNLYSAFS